MPSVDTRWKPSAAVSRPLKIRSSVLQEELGLTATAWTELGQTDPFTANVVSPTRLYLAQGLTFVPASPEGTEQIERVAISFSEAVELVMNGGITHAPSCLAILKAARLLAPDDTAVDGP